MPGVCHANVLTRFRCDSQMLKRRKIGVAKGQVGNPLVERPDGVDTVAGGIEDGDGPAEVAADEQVARRVEGEARPGRGPRAIGRACAALRSFPAP